MQKAMFEILEADIVVFQETKIQRKDLRDDMVLVPGWDCHFSLPRFKKGYSGVAIYTRNATCAPVRAEEGLTGVLCPPNSSVPFRDLPHDQQIGGYPTIEQLSMLELDAATLDSEGRCVILEFPAFVLLGLYCPANRDESRDNFRQGFLDLMDARIRNLVAMGKRVFVTGDLNISRGEIDAAHVSEAIRKGTTTEDDFISAPARRLFNQLLYSGKVIGERDEGREQPALFDICRSFHPNRRGMYTCWEQKINARPGNYGSRIDYVLCSLNMQDWLCDSDIQEGLMGSDHCPVYAMFKSSVCLNGQQVNMLDIMNPPGMFNNGVRRQEYTTKLLLPTSGRLIPEFDKRRSIKDMFSRKPNNFSQKPPTTSASTTCASTREQVYGIDAVENSSLGASKPSPPIADSSPTCKGTVRKRSGKSDLPTSVKRSRSFTSQTAATSVTAQRTLKGFFKPKGAVSSQISETETPDTPVQATECSSGPLPVSSTISRPGEQKDQQSIRSVPAASTSNVNSSRPAASSASQDSETVIDPIVSKEDWSKLFAKKPVPMCEGHQEPCISLSTKKPGINCGRSFWICPRPLGPSGNKEKGTQWRCATFIWASDWNP
ncbi:Endonuclease/exonuclease/phosphatase [Aspergillus pseudotamarii]|uniref:DNA-(apurinic or apyrimidinic site) endonuclease 2 n=1 Tax=Aspergillus pseudotamarii TaxID=132259 RepID=A0A5N6T0H3_ASPPS|nr:Endonuclease/exonuclease/phosphatase [Aspergillus pseudotamarii]KAE8139660.1 Endonuclease/exonuclease/phosphatase [Aspergillus pseudotamarii]